jgi:hypothetical protein
LHPCQEDSQTDSPRFVLVIGCKSNQVPILQPGYFEVFAISSMSIFQRLFSKPQPPQVKVEVIRRDVCRMTLAEWRSSEERCNEVGRIISHPTARAMLDVLRTEHLGRYGALTHGIESMALAAARAEGYGMCLNTLEKMAIYEQPKVEVQESWDERMSDMIDNA